MQQNQAPLMSLWHPHPELLGACAEGQSCFGETIADISAVADHRVLSFIFALDLLFILSWTLYDYYVYLKEFMFIFL